MKKNSRIAKISFSLFISFCYYSVKAQMDNYSVNDTKIFVFKYGHFVINKNGNSTLQVYHSLEIGDNIFRINLDGSVSVVTIKSPLQKTTNYINSLISVLNDVRPLELNFSSITTKIGGITIWSSGNKISKIGDINIFYSGDKVSRIGDVNIFYSGDKVSRIGDVNIFYSGDKVSRIGDMNITYSQDKVIKIGATDIKYN
jgi:hypothetical protein